MPDEVVMQPYPETCKCGKMRQPVMNYARWETGERFKFCYYCDPRPPREEREMWYASDR